MFQGIDDYASVSIATVHVTYIRWRIEQFAEYLSNGLSGNGIGLLSSSDMGFINKRFQTQRFSSMTISTPLLGIPEHGYSSKGVVLH